jgi:predicted nucleic acid-binding protein
VKANLVLDSGVLTLHFAGDPRLRQYFDRISEEDATGLVSEVNLAEYFYKTCQKLGRETADSRYYMLRASKLLIVSDEWLTRLAGLEKCRQRLDLSLADCFALALAKRESATLLTTDTELSKSKDVKVKLFTV